MEEFTAAMCTHNVHNIHLVQDYISPHPPTYSLHVSTFPLMAMAPCGLVVAGWSRWTLLLSSSHTAPTYVLWPDMTPHGCSVCGSMPRGESGPLTGILLDIYATPYTHTHIHAHHPTNTHTPELQGYLLCCNSVFKC